MSKICESVICQRCQGDQKMAIYGITCRYYSGHQVRPQCCKHSRASLSSSRRRPQFCKLLELPCHLAVIQNFPSASRQDAECELPSKTSNIKFLRLSPNFLLWRMESELDRDSTRLWASKSGGSRRARSLGRFRIARAGLHKLWANLSMTDPTVVGGLEEMISLILLFGIV